MEQFEYLPRSSQILYMRQLAKKALTAYELGEAQLTLLQHWLNTTFQVKTCPEGYAAANHTSVSRPHQERFVLHMSRPGFQNEALIRSELQWLLALRQQAGFVVPEPLATRNGSLLTTVTIPNICEPRHCVLFHWVDGRQYRRSKIGTVQLERVGTFIAKLHCHSEQFKPPPGFVRKRWDCEGILVLYRLNMKSILICS